LHQSKDPASTYTSKKLTLVCFNQGFFAYLNATSKSGSTHHSPFTTHTYSFFSIWIAHPK
jgi:hypothetical protein